MQSLTLWTIIINFIIIEIFFLRFFLAQSSRNEVVINTPTRLQIALEASDERIN